MTEGTTEYTIVGPEGIYHGRSRQRYPHTIAADALREATGTPWQHIEYRETRRGPCDSVWEVAGRTDTGDRSGPADGPVSGRRGRQCRPRDGRRPH